MALYQVMTSNKERNAVPGMIYFVLAKSEEDAISKVYANISKGIETDGYRNGCLIPDHTCAVLVFRK